MIEDWSDGQMQCLEALGYTLYRCMPSPLNDHALASEPASILPERKEADPQQKSVSGAIGHRMKSEPIEPLLRALLQASQVDPARIDDPGAWLRAQQIPSLTQLRNNPAAKRALWPRLRQLRREHDTR